MNAEIELQRAFERFQPSVTVDARSVSSDILQRVIARNYKLAYYVASVSSNSVFLGFRSSMVFDMEYQNTDMPMSDIHIAKSSEEMQNLLERYVGDYKRRLVIFTAAGVNGKAEYEKFRVMSAAFYANFTAATVTVGKSSMTDMLFYDFNFEYRIGSVKLEMMENEVDREVERLAAQMFLPGMSDATKAFLAHNYLAYTIDYTLKDTVSNLEKSYMQSAYGALIKKKCVCQGYAEAFKRLMDYAGIECEVVCGQIKGSSEYHAWNMIMLNGGADSYHIDVTWDSTGGRVSQDYFGLKDSDLAADRTWDHEFYPSCNSSKPLIVEARRGIMVFKPRLLANGVDRGCLGY